MIVFYNEGKTRVYCNFALWKSTTHMQFGVFVFGPENWFDLFFWYVSILGTVTAFFEPWFWGLSMGSLLSFTKKDHAFHPGTGFGAEIWQKCSQEIIQSSSLIWLSPHCVTQYDIIWDWSISCFTYMIGNLPSIPDLNLAPKFWCYCTSSLQLHAPSEMGNLGEDFGVQSQLSQKVFGALGLKNPKLPSGNLT